MRLAVWLCLVVFAVSLDAAEVTMKNGDRISGDVQSLDGGKLKLNTPYAGTIEIDWTQVESMESEKTVKVLLDDGTLIDAAQLGVREGNVRVVSPDGSQGDYDLLELTYINPSPEVLNQWIFSGTVNLGGNATAGNTATRFLHFDTELRLKDKYQQLALGGQYNHQSDSGDDTVDNMRAWFNYKWFFHPDWFFVLNTDAQRDPFRDLNLRAFAGPGIGHKVWESDPRNLSFSLGVNFAHEDFSTTPVNNYAAGRWALDFDHYLFTSKLQIYLHHTGLQSLKDGENLLLQTRTGLKMPLIDKFNLKLEYEIDYDREPAPGKQPTDVKYSLLFGYDWP
ncbi:MAG: DUF481 domain-containing protein [Pseudomonadota bacterium]|nr:DUF481 domain-containing protein [Pseudomonadota bacterium]